MRPRLYALCILAACFVAQPFAGPSPRAQERRNAGVRPVESDERVALVIGNADYNSEIGRLKNPVNDATDVAAALKRLGFSLVGERAQLNLSKRRMLELIREFGGRIQRGGVGVFYFAGHGVQVDKHNYLIPITDLLQYQEDAEYEAVDADAVLREMEYSENSVNILILDACRNNNLPKKRRGTANGLTEPSRKPEGTLIAFSTADGQTASDNAEGRNGLFTQELLKYIEAPNVPLDRIFRNIRNEVKRLSKNSQLPFLYQSLSEDVFLNTTETVAARPTPTPNIAANNTSNTSAVADNVELVRFQDANGKYGYKDEKSGAVVIEPKYEMAYPFYSQWANVRLNGKEGFINKRGEVMIRFKYDFFKGADFGDLAAVKVGDKYGFIDRNENVVIPMKYEDAGNFYEGLAGVKLNGKYGFIDKTDRVVIPFKYDDVWTFYSGWANVRLNGKEGFIDKADNLVIPLSYDSISNYFEEGLAWAKLDGKYGFIDKTNKVVIPFKYDSAESFSGGKARVTLSGREFYIDKNGNEVAGN